MQREDDKLILELKSLTARSAEILKSLDSQTVAPHVVRTNGPSYGSYARSVVTGRAKIAEFFPGHLFADPAFDILLDLFASEAEGRKANVKSVCIAARVPTTTGIRWVELLVDRGLVQRERDHLDRRNVRLRLSASAHERMAAYLEKISSIPLRRD